MEFIVDFESAEEIPFPVSVSNRNRRRRNVIPVSELNGFKIGDRVLHNDMYSGNWDNHILYFIEIGDFKVPCVIFKGGWEVRLDICTHYTGDVPVPSEVHDLAIRYA